MTSINNINVHLTVLVSLRVPPLLAYNLSYSDVIHLLFSLPLLASYLAPNFLSNLTTALLFVYNLGRYCEIGNLSGSHDFIMHSPKNRVKHQHIHENRNI